MPQPTPIKATDVSAHTPDVATHAANDAPLPVARKVLDLSQEASAKFVWRGHQQFGVAAPVVSSGFDRLDQLLPGGGWPLNTLCEWLTPGLGHGEWALLKPVLACLSARGMACVLINPPAMPYAPALLQAGIDLRQLFVVQTGPETQKQARGKPHGTQALWATEQALRAGCLGAVIAFCPQADSQNLRRLKLACEAHRGFCVVLRDVRHATESSPAALRLRLRRQPSGMALELLKLRGAPSGQALQLTA
jgi:protein ImuA